MGELFRAGIESFQRRCPELLDVLGIEGSVARAACEDPDAVARARMADIASCQPRPLPVCGGPLRCHSGPWRFRSCERSHPFGSRYPDLSRCMR